MEATYKKNSRNLDLTKGSILKGIILFALPLLLGNLFQQFYNIVDSWVVGNYVSNEALAAVSTSGSLISFFTSLVVGTCAGAGIVIAQHFGAKNTERMQNAIHTTVAFGLVASVILTIVAEAFAPTLIKFMSDDEVVDISIDYFRVYFSGVFFTVMYNVGSSIFRAVGDSRHPLYYLIASSIVNVILDIIFVKYLGLGVKSVALATIISQAVSSIATFIHLMCFKTDYQVVFKKIRFHKEEIGKILLIGLPNGIQNSIISFSNMFVLRNIASFGKIAQAGWGTYNKIEGFATMPSGSFSIACSNFIGQNVGAKEYDRVKKGSRIGLLLTMLVTEFLGAMLWIFSPILVSLFTSDAEVINYGVSACRTISLFYFLLSLAHGLAGVLRGAGISITPMLTMLICWCLVRITLITPFVNHFQKIEVIYWFYPVTWTISIIVMGSIYLFYDWPHYKAKKEEA